ncbi:hypothetical protein VAWG001_30720 [Aeromonas dhakensis]|nr:hypothetical protein VAWG001_30720 [Aeromonas dhakensis]
MFQQMGQLDADQSALTEGEQLLGGGVDELDAEPFIHQNDGSQQVVEQYPGLIRAGWHWFLPKTVLYTSYAPMWCI